MMDRLPNELLVSIFSHLVSQEVGTVRLVCRHWCKISSSFLFPRIWLSSHCLDLRAFRTIIASPEISKGVHELIWDDTTFCASLLDFENYKIAALSEVGSYVPMFGSEETTDAELARIEDGYQLFRKHAVLEGIVRRRRLDEKALISALPGLTGLKKVVLSSRWHDDRYAIASTENEQVRSPTARNWNHEPAFEDLAFPPSVNWKTVETESHLFASSEAEAERMLRRMRSVDFYEDVRDESWATHDDSVHVLRPFRGFVILIRALTKSETKLEEFVIRPQYRACFENHENSMRGISQSFFRFESPELDCLVNVFAHLRKLVFVMSCDGIAMERFPGSAAELAIQRNFRRALQAAKKLELLDLELPEQEVMRFLDPSFCFPRLRALRLVGGRVEPLQLLQFMRTHRSQSSNLQALSLAYCESTTVSWREFFLRLREEGLRFELIRGVSLLEPKGICESMYRCLYTVEEEEIERFWCGKGGAPLGARIDEARRFGGIWEDDTARAEEGIWNISDQES